MINIDQLPIPDWDLHCPACGTALAGMPEHCCRRCGRRFDIRRLLDLKRPVPSLDLHCEACDYSLNGLPGDRCPECGTKFSIRDLLEIEEPIEFNNDWLSRDADPTDHHLKKREPRFSGAERPLPDFGLFCDDCGGPLAGAPANACPACTCPFHLQRIIPRGDWVNLGRFITGPLRPMAKTVLYHDEIPYMVSGSGLSTIYTGISPLAEERLLVPREFFFDALHALAATEPASTEADATWTCPTCAESVPAGFDICWKCNTSRQESPGTEPG
ncbi:MAG: hypothetical protein KA354_12820 [Phycisphaerae bacterium]|nr:hypothetical protein [Phycisphaerae bacterium]